MEEGEIRLTPDVALSIPKEKGIRKKQHAKLSGGKVNSAQHDNAADKSTIIIAKDIALTPKEKINKQKQHAGLSGGTVNSAQHDNAANRSKISIAKDKSSITMC